MDGSTCWALRGSSGWSLVCCCSWKPVRQALAPRTGVREAPCSGVSSGLPSCHFTPHWACCLGWGLPMFARRLLSHCHRRAAPFQIGSMKLPGSPPLPHRCPSPDLRMPLPFPPHLHAPSKGLISHKDQPRTLASLRREPPSHLPGFQPLLNRCLRLPFPRPRLLPLPRPQLLTNPRPSSPAVLPAP